MTHKTKKTGSNCKSQQMIFVRKIKYKEEKINSKIEQKRSQRRIRVFGKNSCEECYYYNGAPCKRVKCEPTIKSKNEESFLNKEIKIKVQI